MTMSPSAAAALALLGLWILAVFAVTNAAGVHQLQASTPAESTDSTNHVGAESTPLSEE
jgi:hypothetical protein